MHNAASDQSEQCLPLIQQFSDTFKRSKMDVSNRGIGIINKFVLFF